MPDNRLVEWKKLCVIGNILEAEILRGYLESSGIDVYFKSEAIGQIHGLTTGPLGEIEIFVKKDQFKNAEKLLEDLDDGKNSTDED